VAHAPGTGTHAEQLGKRIFAVERHQVSTKGIVRRMQRNRQGHRAILASRSIMGTTPEVDTVTRRRDKP
jgi:hypothetical protein